MALGSHALKLVDQCVHATIVAFDHGTKEFPRLNVLRTERMSCALSQKAKEDQLGAPVTLAKWVHVIDITEKIGGPLDENVRVATRRKCRHL